jgi:hypothetical protein
MPICQMFNNASNVIELAYLNSGGSAIVRNTRMDEVIPDVRVIDSPESYL